MAVRVLRDGWHGMADRSQAVTSTWASVSCELRATLKAGGSPHHGDTRQPHCGAHSCMQVRLLRQLLRRLLRRLLRCSYCRNYCRCQLSLPLTAADAAADDTAAATAAANVMASFPPGGRPCASVAG